MPFFTLGVVGTCLFSVLFMFAVYSYHRAQMLGKTLICHFFTAMIVYAALEIPRYVFMIAQNDYKSKVGYCFHVIAVGCYFVALSIICLSWMFLLSLEKQAVDTSQRKKLTLVVSNVTLFIFIILSIYFCAEADSLESYFDSKFYLVYMVAEVIIFLFYNSAVLYFGLKISSRFRNYIHTGGEKTEAFRSALTKVLTLMIVDSICAATRVTMLSLKFLHDVKNFQADDNAFAHFGVLWFTLTDFLPFLLGGACFMFVTVSSGKKGNDIVETYPEHQNDMNKSLVPNSSDKKNAPVSTKTSSWRTPNRKDENIVDSDVDYTPDNGDSTFDKEEYGTGSNGRRPASFDCNSSLTTNSPSFRYGINEEWSPHDVTHKRWISFSSSSMLPNSVSPATPGSRQHTKSLNFLKHRINYTPPNFGATNHNKSPPYRAKLPGNDSESTDEVTENAENLT